VGSGFSGFSGGGWGRGVGSGSGVALGFGVIGCGAGFGLGFGVVGGGVASGTARICSRALRKAFFFSRSAGDSAFCPRAGVIRQKVLMNSKVASRTAADANEQGLFANFHRATL
jgi:hypothetical protein